MSRKRISYLSLLVVGILLLFALSEFLWNRNEANKLAEEETVETEEESVIDETILAKLQSGNYNNENLKLVFLTFNGGPDSNTTSVLDILSENEVDGTFFINGESGATNKESLTRIIDDGHTLANYTYTSNVDLSSREAFMQSIAQNEAFIEEQTGTTSSKIFRFPDGSTEYSQELIDQLTTNGFNYVDWNVSVAEDESKTASDITKEIIDQVHHNSVSVISTNTDSAYFTAALEGLNQAIKELKQEGYTFLTIDPTYKLARFTQPTGSVDPVTPVPETTEIEETESSDQNAIISHAIGAIQPFFRK